MLYVVIMLSGSFCSMYLRSYSSGLQSVRKIQGQRGDTAGRSRFSPTAVAVARPTTRIGIILHHPCSPLPPPTFPSVVEAGGQGEERDQNSSSVSGSTAAVVNVLKATKGSCTCNWWVRNLFSDGGRFYSLLRVFVLSEGGQLGAVCMFARLHTTQPHDHNYITPFQQPTPPYLSPKYLHGAATMKGCCLAAIKGCCLAALYLACNACCAYASGDGAEAAAVYDVGAGTNSIVAVPAEGFAETLAFMLVPAASADEAGLEGAEEDSEAGEKGHPHHVSCQSKFCD